MSVNGSKAEVKSLFIAAGCNRIVNNVSWGASGLVSFGAQNAVAIFCPKLAQILTTLPGHKAAVNCTHWLPSNKFAFKAKHLERHYLLSGDADGTIILWELSVADNKWRLVLQLPQSHKKGTLIVGSRPMVTLSLAQLPGNTGLIALAMGGLDNKIYLYCGERTGKCELDSILLVSSSQDKGIRIWKLTLRGSLANTEGTHKRVATTVNPKSILSASMDKTMMIWQPERKTGIWMNVVTVGELSHCALGFYGGHWSPDARSILAHGYGGSFHMWKNIGVSSDNWQPQKVPSGHFAPVTDITWARYGEYMLSVSHDQTTRIFAPWHNQHPQSNGDSWHEIARPQVHGHDINCAAIIQGKGNHRFVSGAEEKVARVFEAPLSFLKTLHHATSEKSSFPEDVQADVQVLGANMSALGLYTKPIYVNATHEVQDNPGNDGLDTL
ncbi:hypothetical protein GQ457_18G021400 [Hibiscus cannabinus]